MKCLIWKTTSAKARFIVTGPWKMTSSSFELYLILMSKNLIPALSWSSIVQLTVLAENLLQQGLL